MRKLIQREAMVCLLTMSAMFMFGSADAGPPLSCPNEEYCEENCQWFLLPDGSYIRICNETCICDVR